MQTENYTSFWLYKPNNLTGYLFEGNKEKTKAPLSQVYMMP